MPDVMGWTSSGPGRLGKQGWWEAVDMEEDKNVWPALWKKEAEADPFILREIHGNNQKSLCGSFVASRGWETAMKVYLPRGRSPEVRGLIGVCGPGAIPRPGAIPVESGLTSSRTHGLLLHVGEDPVLQD